MSNRNERVKHHISEDKIYKCKIKNFELKYNIKFTYVMNSWFH